MLESVKNLSICSSFLTICFAKAANQNECHYLIRTKLLSFSKKDEPT